MRGRRGKQLLDGIKETRGYCELKKDALDRTLWRISFGRGCGPVVRQIAGRVTNGSNFPILKARLHESPRLINTVESTKVNRVKARLHGSPRVDQHG